MNFPRFAVAVRTRLQKLRVDVLLAFGMFALFLSPAPAQVNTSTQNPLQITLLHWYRVNLTAQFIIAGGDAEALGLTFDGKNVWLVGGCGVSKVRASHGAVLGTFCSPRGAGII